MPHKRLIGESYKNIDINSIEIVIIESGAIFVEHLRGTLEWIWV
jgi:hypothetical protein